MPGAHDWQCYADPIDTGVRSSPTLFDCAASGVRAALTSISMGQRPSRGVSE